MYPATTAIYTSRHALSRRDALPICDPRDVAVSGADHFGRTVDAMIEMMADPLATCAAMPGIIVHELQSSWSHHVSSWTRWNHPGIFAVRYEIGRAHV